MFYTNKEKTEKNRKVGDAAATARIILENNHNVFEVCCDALKGKLDSTLLTLEEFNDLVDQLVFDSCYYA